MAANQKVSERELSPSEAYEEALKKQSTKEALQELRDMIAGEPNLKVGMDDKYLMKFLWPNDFDITKSFQTLTKFYKVRSERRDNFCFENPVNYLYLSHFNIFRVLKNRDKDGRLIIVCYEGNIDPSKHSFEELTKINDIAYHIFLEDEQTVRARGGILIITGTGLKWSIVRWVTPRNIILYAKIFEIVPLHHQHSHFVNIPSLLKAPIAIGYSLISSCDIAANMHFHYSDMEAMHNFVDSEILPESLGGKVPDEEAFQDLEEYILQRQERLAELHSYGYQS